MSGWLEGLVRKGMEELAREFPQMRREMDEAGGVLLFGTIGGAAYFRPDGTVWLHWTARSPNEPDRYEWHEATGNERWGALVLGARRMPELLQLLPVRGADVPDCTRCGGTGFVLGGVVCPDCGGLGWIAQGAA